MARMTYYHKELLVEFIEMNSIMVKNKGRGESEETEESRRLWEELGLRLSAAGAATRTGDEWKKAWCELVCRTKKLARLYCRRRDMKKQLTPLDHRILAAAHANLTIKPSTRPAPRSRDGVKSTARLLAECPASSPAPVPPDEDDTPLSQLPTQSPHTSPSPVLNGCGVTEERSEREDVFPAWLFESERARVEASRKTAEALGELAEAARAHSHTLQQLLHTAQAQAEAIERIARVLENKFS